MPPYGQIRLHVADHPLKKVGLDVWALATEGSRAAAGGVSCPALASTCLLLRLSGQTRL